MKTIRAWLNVDLREEKRLTQAHTEFRHLKEEALNLKANDNHELVKCHKMSNYLECSDAVAVAALARKETRLEHIREDYPLTDNKEWLKWIIVQRLQDDLHARLEDIPIHKWRYRPEPVVVDRLKLKSEE
jgi:succinate dehydrogenase/fumarate reductase flavoprotein subunit